ncbi:hypothetical protein NP493_678g01057 [Ridgeia piscesae]|uniref:Uncharacterized protein n=1 Tax=Ridgeia piscesae TaxID=27915 RepID=A0AAD9KRH5_RIDPI|nr:hypothetical protein NP493_678g01057 [Ridgeia piscesae]
MKTNSLNLNDSKTEVIVFGSAQQLNKMKLQALRVGDCLVGCLLLDIQFHAEMTMDSHVTVVCKSAIFHPQHLEDQTVISSDRASHTRMCYLQTRCWQCTAISTASEANTSASESAELGTPLDLPTAP